MLIPAAFMQAMSAYVAQNHGAGEQERAERGLRIAILVSTAFGAVMFWAAFFHGDLLCAIFARDADVIAAGCDYLRAYGIDCLLCVLRTQAPQHAGKCRTRIAQICISK